MNTTGPGWYIVEVEDGRVVWVKEGPYDRNTAESAAKDCSARSGEIKALWWDGKVWSSTPHKFFKLRGGS